MEEKREMQKRERKRVAALLKLLCRSLRSGRAADHLLSSTRKLSDANRFVSGRFKRFTIIRADSNSINASSSPPSSCTSTPLPSFCTLYVLTAYKSQYSLSFVFSIHGAWTMRILRYVPRSLDDLELRNVLPNAEWHVCVCTLRCHVEFKRYVPFRWLNITKNGRKYADPYCLSINLRRAKRVRPH